LIGATPGKPTPKVLNARYEKDYQFIISYTRADFGHSGHTLQPAPPLLSPFFVKPLSVNLLIYPQEFGTILVI
jgi:hypothetical protein